MNRILPPLTDDQKSALVVTARALLHTPFKHQGRTREGGVDCLGFVALCFALQGYDVRPPSNYGRVPYGQQIEAGLTAYLGPPVAVRPLRDFALQSGDVVACTWNIEANHVAIITPHPDRGVGMIHCYNAAKRVVEHGIDPIWRSRITAVWRP